MAILLLDKDVGDLLTMDEALAAVPAIRRAGDYFIAAWRLVSSAARNWLVVSHGWYMQ